jgi:hypothetical protein
MPGAGLGLVWLDGRAMQAGHGEPGGDMSVRAATYDAAGRPIVAYRDRSDTEIRDIHVSRLVGGTWTPPAPVHRDNWQIAACPVNGPALSADGKAVALAWFTAKGDEGHAFIAFSADSGRTFGSPIRLDDSSALGRVGAALLADGSAVATWIEFAEGQAQFRLRRITPQGSRGAAIAVAGLSANRATGTPSTVKTARMAVTAVTPTR